MSPCFEIYSFNSPITFPGSSFRIFNFSWDSSLKSYAFQSITLKCSTCWVVYDYHMLCLFVCYLGFSCGCLLFGPSCIYSVLCLSIYTTRLFPLLSCRLRSVVLAQHHWWCRNSVEFLSLYWSADQITTCVLYIWRDFILFNISKLSHLIVERASF